ncbi:MAG: response regulator [Rhodospirillales bacterium]|nr:response regulator [Rhodospirillales bacterium]
MRNASRNDLVKLFIDDLTDYAIVSLDPHGVIVSWNAGAETLLGYAAKEIVGRRHSDLYTKSDALTGNSNTALKDALQWGRHEAMARLARKDGTMVEARILLRPLSDPWTRLAGFGMLAYDVGRLAHIVADQADPAAVKVLPRRSITKILVVDDNDGVLEEAVEQLTSLGYEVVSASNGAQALEVLKKETDVDLLFTDVVMPGDLGGRALAERARQMRPGLKVLFASGYFEGALVGKGDLETDVRFLTKPYVKRELAKKIEETLKSAR